MPDALARALAEASYPPSTADVERVALCLFHRTDSESALDWYSARPRLWARAQTLLDVAHA